MIVTDHHLPADQLPSARCIVNPNAFGDQDAACLAGVGVAFYLMLALRAELKQRNWFGNRDVPNLGDCLDLVALGTVADLVPLDHNNRILVYQGLKRMRAGQTSMGISQLLMQANVLAHNVSSQDLAFALAPRINAAGRLDDMSVGVRTLLAQDVRTAAALANELNAINRYRRELQGEMSEQAVAMLQDLEREPAPQRHVQVLFREEWHEGIIGIIASRIKDLSFRPAICFAASDHGELKGSCRSIPGIHIRDMLDLVDKRVPGIIQRFGGHAMAAGLTIRRQGLAEFIAALDDTIRDHNDAEVFANRVYHDGELEQEWLTLETARMVLDAGPWGQRFPLPSFVGEFQVTKQRILADRHVKFLLTAAPGQQPIEALLFFASPQELATDYDQIRIHFELAVNEFREQQNLQLIIRHLIVN